MKSLRVLLADDHRIVAEGLKRLLEPNFELVGMVEDGLALLAAARELKPDVIIHLPEGRDIIVDAKVSLISWERFVNCEDEGERATHLAQLVRAVREGHWLLLDEVNLASAETLLTRLAKATRRLMLIDDLRRTSTGYFLAWCAGRVLTRSPVVRTDGPLSVEWEDCGMDREHGAAEAAEFVHNLDFAPSRQQFDSAFAKES